MSDLSLDFPGGDGRAAPPRSNGEFVFNAPWESRIFGVTISLHRAGLFEWDEFRRLLIEEIGEWESSGQDPSSWSYYHCWQEALERLLVEKRLLSAQEFAAHCDALARRPAGHDH
ncbi:MAG TPA: nitrile hydratase accessory protein [Candidatus Binatia bacterium]|jgi:nitrile hydratase accessory protein